LEASVGVHRERAKIIGGKRFFLISEMFGYFFNSQTCTPERAETYKNCPIFQFKIIPLNIDSDLQPW